MTGKRFMKLIRYKKKKKKNCNFNTSKLNGMILEDQYQ